MNSEAGSELPCHQYLKDVCSNINDQAYGKNNNTFIKRIFACKRRSGTQPEKKNIRIERVEQKAGNEYFEKPGPRKFYDAAFRILKFNLFKEHVKNAHQQKKNTS